MNQKQREFAEALRLYGSELLNGFGWESWPSLETGSATVNIGLNRFGNIVVTAVETHEQDVITLENELEEAKKTIKAQAKENKSLTEQIESQQTQVQEEEVTIAEVTEAPTRTTKRRVRAA